MTSTYGANPWAASIRLRGDRDTFHHCGAVVLSEFYVLTAGHCMEQYPRNVIGHILIWTCVCMCKVNMVIFEQVSMKMNMAVVQDRKNNDQCRKKGLNEDTTARPH